MAGSVNKVILVGNLGRDPEIRSMQSGEEIAQLSIATSETWRDKASGERKERTECHTLAPLFRHGHKFCASQILPGDRLLCCHDLVWGALGDDLAAMHAGGGAHVDHVIGSTDCLLVMLHHQHGWLFLRVDCGCAKPTQPAR